MKHNFEERRQNRIQYAKQQAEKNEKKSESLHNSADQMASYIPLGQPILVGHHSEKADRNYRKKIRNTFEKAIEAGDKAGYYADKAKTIESNDAIFSDDPKAVEKLDAKIEKLEKLQTLMKAANKFVKKKDKHGFLELEGVNERLWETLNQPDCFGELGFASSKLKNNSANIRRLKARRDQLQKQEAMETQKATIKGIKVVYNVEANRIQLFFPSKPSGNVRTDLFKKYSFRWCRSEGAWQRHLNNAGIFAVKQFLANYQEENT